MKFTYALIASLFFSFPLFSADVEEGKITLKEENALFRLELTKSSTEAEAYASYRRKVGAYIRQNVSGKDRGNVVTLNANMLADAKLYIRDLDKILSRALSALRKARAHESNPMNHHNFSSSNDRWVSQKAPPKDPAKYLDVVWEKLQDKLKRLLRPGEEREGVEGARMGFLEQYVELRKLVTSNDQVEASIAVFLLQRNSNQILNSRWTSRLTSLDERQLSYFSQAMVLVNEAKDELRANNFWGMSVNDIIDEVFFLSSRSRFNTPHRLMHAFLAATEHYYQAEIFHAGDAARVLRNYLYEWRYVVGELGNAFLSQAYREFRTVSLIMYSRINESAPHQDNIRHLGDLFEAALEGIDQVKNERQLQYVRAVLFYLPSIELDQVGRDTEEYVYSVSDADYRQIKKLFSLVGTIQEGSDLVDVEKAILEMGQSESLGRLLQSVREIPTHATSPCGEKSRPFLVYSRESLTK